jgi:hypothetical protein
MRSSSRPKRNARHHPLHRDILADRYAIGRKKGKDEDDEEMDSERRGREEEEQEIDEEEQEEVSLFPIPTHELGLPRIC